MKPNNLKPGPDYLIRDPIGHGTETLVLAASGENQALAKALARLVRHAT